MAKYVHSFSAVSEYHNCPRKMHENRILKRFPFVETDAIRYGNRLHKAFELRITKGTPLPEEFQAYESLMKSVDAMPGSKYTELKMGLQRSGRAASFFGGSVWYRGVGDLVIIDEDRKIGFYYDWKTGASFKPQFIASEQLRDNAVMMFAEFREVDTVYAALMYTQHDKMFPEDGPMEYKRSDFDAYFEQMQTDAAPIEESMESGHWPERPNPLCGYCPVKECQHWYDAKASK